MWEDSDAAHDRFDRVRIDDTFFHAWDEESRLAASEVVIKVNEECEERRLASIDW